MDIAEDQGEMGSSQFSIGEDDTSLSSSPVKEAIPHNSGIQTGTPKDLKKESSPNTSQQSGRLSRHPSNSSLYSDASFLASAESSYHPYHFQVLLLYVKQN